MPAVRGLLCGPQKRVENQELSVSSDLTVKVGERRITGRVQPRLTARGPQHTHQPFSKERARCVSSSFPPRLPLRPSLPRRRPPPNIRQPQGYGYGYNNYGQIRRLQVRIDQLQRQISHLDRLNILSEREASPAAE